MSEKRMKRKNVFFFFEKWYGSPYGKQRSQTYHSGWDQKDDFFTHLLQKYGRNASWGCCFSLWEEWGSRVDDFRMGSTFAGWYKIPFCKLLLDKWMPLVPISHSFRHHVIERHYTCVTIPLAIVEVMCFDNNMTWFFHLFWAINHYNNKIFNRNTQMLRHRSNFFL